MKCCYCDRKTANPAFHYICENGHRHPVHRDCRTVYARCVDCKGKIIATASHRSFSLERARASYRLFHTCTLKKKLLGGRDDEVVGFRLLQLGLAAEHFYWSHHCVGYEKRSDVEQTHYDAEAARIRKECQVAWLAERKRIGEWFAK